MRDRRPLVTTGASEATEAAGEGMLESVSLNPDSDLRIAHEYALESLIPPQNRAWVRIRIVDSTSKSLMVSH